MRVENSFMYRSLVKSNLINFFNFNSAFDVGSAVTTMFITVLSGNGVEFPNWILNPKEGDPAAGKYGDYCQIPSD
jgi:hypothetical protein